MGRVVLSFLCCFFGIDRVCAQDEIEEVFTEIYQSARWGTNENGEGFSGGGSLLQNVTLYMDYLQEFMSDYDIKTVVDVGCGDWEFSKYINWSKVEYLGYDVVKHIIDKNKLKFAEENIQFLHGNFLTIDLPAADLLICKHVLQHLTNHDIELFIKQLSKYKYCLITNQIDSETLSGDNKDTLTGGAHKLDLTKEPFNLVGSKVLTYEIDKDSVHQVFLIENVSP